MSDLQFIKSASISTATTSFNVEDCFNQGYNIYYLAFQNFNATSGTTIKLRFLDSSNNAISSSLYDWAYLNLTSASSFVDTNATNQNIINFGTTSGNQSSNMNTSAYVYNADNSSSYTYLISQGANGSNLEGRKQITGLKQESLIKGIQITAGANMEIGTLAVFGLG